MMRRSFGQVFSEAIVRKVLLQADSSDAACGSKQICGAGRQDELDLAVISRLREVGLRPTRQRVQLARILFGKGHRHVSAEMIYETSRELKPQPVLATIYNTLHEFSKKGLLREVAAYGNKQWFDTNTGSHFHFYDNSTGEIHDMPECIIPQLKSLVPAGMKINQIDLVVRLEPNVDLPEGDKAGFRKQIMPIQNLEAHSGR